MFKRTAGAGSKPMSDRDQSLPEEFAALGPFVERWNLRDYDARNALRLASTLDELQAFHDALLARAQEILDYLDARPIDAYSEGERVLGRLLLALPVVAQAVEVFRSPAVPDTCKVQIRVTREYRL